MRVSVNIKFNYDYSHNFATKLTMFSLRLAITQSNAGTGILLPLIQIAEHNEHRIRPLMGSFSDFALNFVGVRIFAHFILPVNKNINNARRLECPIYSSVLSWDLQTISKCHTHTHIHEIYSFCSQNWQGSKRNVMEFRALFICLLAH